jgi:conjugation system TraG family ATPase
MKKQGENSLSKAFPVQSVLDDCIVNGNGDLTFCFEVELREVYTITAPEYDTIHDAFVAILAKLPEGYIFHKQDIYWVDEFTYDRDGSYSYPRKKDLENFAFRGMLNHKCYIYLTHSVNTKLHKNYNLENTLFRMQDYFFRKPFKNIEKDYEEAVISADTLEDNLNSISGFKAKRLQREEIFELLERNWNLEFGKDYTPTKTLQPLNVLKDGIKVGDKSVNVVSLTDEGDRVYAYYPSNMVEPDQFKKDVDINSMVDLPVSFTFPLTLGLPVNHIVNSIVEVIDNETISKHLKTEVKGNNVLVSFGNETAAIKANKTKDYILSLANENLQGCKFKQNTIVWNENSKELAREVNGIVNAYSKLRLAKAWKENLQTGNLFLASYPGNTKANFRWNFSTVNNAACYLPKETHVRSDRSGIMFQDRFGRPVVYDFLGTDKVQNRNKLVFGGSGSGKSFWLNHYVSECIHMGFHLVILDKGGSFRETLKLTNSRYIDSSDTKELRFNIFICKKDINGNYLYMPTDENENEDIINYIMVVLQKIWKQDGMISNEEGPVLRKVIIAFYKWINSTKKTPTLNLFFEFLDIFEKDIMVVQDKAIFSVHKFKNSLLPYVDHKDESGEFIPGQYSYLLNDENKQTLGSYRCVAIDLEGVEGNPMLYEIVCYIVVEMASNKIMNLPKDVRKCLLIDEAVDFLQGNTGEFVAGQFRKIRKKGGEVIISTQSVKFMDNIDPMTRTSIEENADTRILVGLGSKPAESLVEAKRFLSLTDNDIEIVKTLTTSKKHRESFIKLGAVPYVIRLEVSPESQLVYSTDPKDVAAKDNYKDSGLSVSQAVNQIIENRKNKN